MRKNEKKTDTNGELQKSPYRSTFLWKIHKILEKMIKFIKFWKKMIKFIKIDKISKNS